LKSQIFKVNVFLVFKPAPYTECAKTTVCVTQSDNTLFMKDFL